MTKSVRSESGKLAFKSPTKRDGWFLALGALSLVVFGNRLYGLVTLASRDERYTHILVVPMISAGLIWVSRRKIFLESRYCPAVAIPALLVGIALLIATGRQPPSSGQDASLRTAVLGIILVWTALFVLCYGVRSLRSAGFAFLFLLFMLPIPAGVMDKAVIALQKGSADVTAIVFRLVGMPFLRVGFKFALPGIDIEIAEECSGIRSSLSLFLSGVLAAHLFLRSGWSQVCFALLIVPIVIFKNAVRIATISWLGVYVDRSFFFGNLHHYGGLPFSLLAVAILALVLLVLRKTETRDETAASRSA